jgi:hypothetical protein
MKNYSIVKTGSEYVVLAGEQRVLRVASRRRAAKLVLDAAELLAMQSEPESPPARGDHQPRVIASSYLMHAKFLDDSRRFP